MNSERFKVGIIGTGVGLRTHAAGFRTLNDVELVGVVGRSIDRTRELLLDGGDDGALACSLDELLTRSPDLVCLTTPPGERQPYVAKLADTAANLLIEKPVAISGREADSLFQAYETTDRFVYVDFQLRGLHAFQTIAKMIREGEFGLVYSIRLRERTSAFRRSKIAEWQERQSTGGGQRLAMGCHLLDLAVYLAGATYERALAGAECANMSTPRGSWLGSEVNITDAADEAFRATVDANGCWIDMFTTAIGAGPRLLEADIEGTEGMASFSFINGRGVLECHSGSGEVRKFAVMPDGKLADLDGTPPDMNPSVFRVAFPNYAREIVDAIKQKSPGVNLATLRDGIENARVLDRLIGAQ